MLKISRNWFNRSRLSLLSWLGVAGVVSCFALVLTFGIMLFPSLPDSAQAVEGDSSVSTYATGTSVSIGVPSTIAFDAVTPTANGATTTANANLTIATTNSASYSLYLYSSDGDNSLKSINPANTSTVDAINNGGVGLTLSSLEPNTWGYSLGTSAATDGTTYSAVPTSNAEPVQTKDTSSTNSANDTYVLSLGAKVDTTIPSGAYSNTLTIAVVAEPGGIPITYNANGGYFNDNPAQTTSIIGYTVETVSTETKIAKTSNISDDGVQDGGYGDNVENIQTISFPGASSLKVTVTYQTESTGYDWLAIYDGSVTPTSSNYADSITGKLGGTTKVENAVFTIPGDTAQFYFRSDSSSSNYYGYYAQVQANPIITPSAELRTPTRPGYTFVGWYKDATGTAGNEFVVDASLEPGTVYAKWGQNFLDDVTYMQDLTATQCSNSYDGATATLRDRRDNNTYTIAKINGNCWMTQNLRLSGGRTLTSADSNVASNWSFPNNSITAGNSYTEARSLISDNTSYGGYYNFCAASAGTNCQDSSTYNTTYDICPKGWRLPTRTEQSGITSYFSAFSPVYSGNYFNGTLHNAGSGGNWWSSTAYNSSDQYAINDDSYGSLFTAINKRAGFSVRCIRSS